MNERLMVLDYNTTWTAYIGYTIENNDTDRMSHKMSDKVRA